MSANQLASAISSVDWNANTAQLLANGSAVARLKSANMRIAVWAKQLEAVDKTNPALSFVREMQTAGHQIAVLIGLALYKPAAASMRNMVEAALYYTFFRSHPMELATLVRDSSYFMDKQDVIEYLKEHSPRFLELQEKLGLLSRLQDWYGNISGVIHGQLPGAWVDHSSVKEIKHVDKTQQLAILKFEEAEGIIYRLLLCTVGVQFWDDFNTNAKLYLLKGLSGDVKALFKLDGS